MLESKFIIFAVNILVFAIPIAILEILIEKDKGWGAGLPKNKWYGRIIGENNFVTKVMARVLGVPYFFGYAVLMYLFLLPLILLAEHFLLLHNFLLIMAIYIAITVIEDFSWFVLNWNFPALSELLKGPQGSIWWHKRWLKVVNGYYLPRSYLAIFGSLILLLIS
ncbi:MAG: hypothetical protein Q8O83_01595 [bacterium]|nr:hypothetical protein [bacterium]